MSRMRCRECAWLDYDFLGKTIELRLDGSHYCGLHGRATVDIDGEQQNLNRRGSCGFFPKEKEDARQLPFPWWR